MFQYSTLLKMEPSQAFLKDLLKLKFLKFRSNYFQGTPYFSDKKLDVFETKAFWIK